MDNIRMEEQLLPDNFDTTSLPSENVNYFKQYGFKVSKAFSEIYKRANGIESEKYIPASLYFYYINPYLVNMNLSMAYVDKNMYSRLFPDVKQPKVEFHNMNGRFFTPPNMEECGIEDVLGTLKSGKIIIKPAIESGRGRDVKLVDLDVTAYGELLSILEQFEANYVIQRLVPQHSEMAKLNATSLNTCRVYTYRRVDNGEYVVLGAAVRFGGKGAYRDNACTGGGFVKIHENGKLDDRIHQYKSFEMRSLKEEKGIEDFEIPSYAKVIKTCISMHKTLPYLDLIGWDIAVDESSDPILIELNQYPDCEFIQLFNGPMFGEYTDALLEKVSHNKLECLSVYKRSFENSLKQNAYNFEIGKAYSI